MRPKTHPLRTLIATGLVATTFLVVPAFAQTSSNTEPAKLKSVVVTGSLLPSAETAQATPVDVITSEAIEKTGAQSIQQLIRTLPSAYGPGNFGDSRGNGGDGSAEIGRAHV